MTQAKHLHTSQLASRAVQKLEQLVHWEDGFNNSIVLLSPVCQGAAFHFRFVVSQVGGLSPIKREVVCGWTHHPCRMVWSFIDSC